MKNIENEIYDTTKKYQAVQWQNERYIPVEKDLSKIHN